jgi:hypothetical protein
LYGKVKKRVISKTPLITKGIQKATGVDVKASGGRKSMVRKTGTPLGVGVTEDLLGNKVGSTKLGG